MIEAGKMRVTDLLSPRNVMLNVSIDQRDDALGFLVELQENSGGITNGTACFHAMCSRENAGGSTGIGDGIALPHAANYGVEAPGISAMVLSEGIDWDAPDGKKVDLIFMVAVPPEEQQGLHLHLLARLVNLLSDAWLVKRLRRAKSTEEFVEILAKREKSDFV